MAGGDWSKGGVFQRSRLLLTPNTASPILNSSHMKDLLMPTKTPSDSPTQSPQKGLKIAVLIRDFVSTGGAEKYAMEVTRRLALDHDLHVFAQHWSFDGKEKITFHRVPRFFIKPSFLNQLLFSYFTHRSVDQSFDIIHSYERVSLFDVFTIQSSCFRSLITRHKSLWRRILVWLAVFLSPRKMAYLWLERKQFTYDKGRLLIAVSENIKQNVQDNYSLPDDSFRLAYTAVDSVFAIKGGNNKRRKELRSQFGITEDDLVILFVGTEFKRKGLDALLKAAASIPRSKIKLVVAGGGGGRLKEYTKLADELVLGNDIIFLGLVRNVEELYTMSDIYILPTLSDPCPLSPLEAMASGVATIMSCSKYAGTAELIKNGEALILENPKDTQEIASALRRVMEKSYRDDLSKKGRQLAETLTWERTTEATLATYYEVLERKGSRPK
jgi:UDP-glucose:(heptosyl)LPS alpha-1,3-glucosyltransferase